KKGIVPKVMEYKIITKNGEERWWLQFNIGSYDINAHLTSVSSIIVDNTERKIAEIKLKESEEKFRSLVQQSVAGIIIVKDNQIIFANDVVAKQSGLDISTITSLEIDDLNQIIHPEDFNFVKKQVQIASEKGSVPEFYARGIRPDGKIIWFAAQLNRFSYEESSAVAAILVGVTERIELQHKLIKERNKAQKYFDIAGTLLVVLDTNCNVVQINRRGSNILQYPKEEIIGKNWIENFIPQKNRAKARNILSQILNEEIQPEDTFQNYVLTKKGEERLIIWHNTYLKNEEGKIESVISSGEDVTNLINL
ncbi:MAG: PAS domain S-box protein, partial [Asgard group archaeon]|nr:PAS domain S-box protein [Asgard group archaeon]